MTSDREAFTMNTRNVLIVDGPLRGEVRECADSYFDHIHAESPSTPDDAVFTQIRYEVKELVAFNRTLLVATSEDEFDDRNMIDLILSPAAKAATR